MNGKTCKALRRLYKKNNGGNPAKQAYFETVSSLSIPVYDTRKEKKLLRTRHNRVLVPAIMSEWRPLKQAYMAMKRMGAPLQNFRMLASTQPSVNLLHTKGQGDIFFHGPSAS